MSLPHVLDSTRDGRSHFSQTAVLDLLPSVTGESQYSERIAIKNRGRVVLVATGEIDYIQAAGNYAELHLGPRCYLLRLTMQALESKLDPGKFVRVHRSTIVNLSRVRELQFSFASGYVVVIEGNIRLALSRTYRDHVQTALGMGA